jgi:hypothetical protein
LTADAHVVTGHRVVGQAAAQVEAELARGDQRCFRCGARSLDHVAIRADQLSCDHPLVGGQQRVVEVIGRVGLQRLADVADPLGGRVVDARQ